MTTRSYVVQHVFPTTAALLPPEMSSPAAWAMLMAIGMQESRFLARRQIAGRREDGTKILGPARGWWQFELGGTEGVLEHPAARNHAGLVLSTMGYSADPREIHLALEHNDVLAAVFARLYLWTSPKALPAAGEADRGWELYTSTWRPGAPHLATWAGNFSEGWASTTLPGTVRT